MLAQYRAVLSKPGALVFSSAAWVGRLWLSMTNLGILLLITATTHRYGIAGAVSATYAITGALGQPYLGPADRPTGPGARAAAAGRRARRRRRVSLLLLADGPRAALVAVRRRAAHRPVLPAARVRRCAPGGPHLLGSGRQLDTAYALESVLDELLFVLGPALVTRAVDADQPGRPAC